MIFVQAMFSIESRAQEVANRSSGRYECTDELFTAHYLKNSERANECFSTSKHHITYDIYDAYRYILDSKYVPKPTTTFLCFLFPIGSGSS